MDDLKTQSDDGVVKEQEKRLRSLDDRTSTQMVI
jgi:hypothetical protein